MRTFRAHTLAVTALCASFFIFTQSPMNIQNYFNYDLKYSTKNGYGASLDEVFNSAEFMSLLEKIPVGSTLLSHGARASYGKHMELAFRNIYQTYPTYTHNPSQIKAKQELDEIFNIKNNINKTEELISSNYFDYLLLWPATDPNLIEKLEKMTATLQKKEDIQINEFYENYNRFVLLKKIN